MQPLLCIDLGKDASCAGLRAITPKVEARKKVREGSIYSERKLMVIRGCFRLN